MTKCPQIGGPLYVLSQSALGSGVTVQAKIRSDNVFTQCDCCGEENPVDLSDILSDGKSNLENTVLLCSTSAC